MGTLILRRNDVRGLLNMAAVIKAVETAFIDMAAGKAAMPAKVYLTVEKGDFRAMPAMLPGIAGIKWVNVHPGNPARRLPTVMATLIYSDPDTGYPLAVMEASDLTAYRTGAAAAVAAKYLAVKNPRTLGIIGAGRQAYTQLLAHLEIFELEKVKVFDIVPENAARLIKSFPGHPLVLSTMSEAAASDIVCTATTAREPVLKKEWVKPGTHINAIGADAPGKQELDPGSLKTSIIVVDDIEQASHAGEINVPISKGIISIKDIHATLGEIISGRKPGRSSDKEVTVFDSTGVAIEDIAVAKLLYEEAKMRGGYLNIDFAD